MSRSRQPRFHIPHSRGQVIALGFAPMLAYAQQANFKPTTLEETWPPAPRELVQLPLTLAHVTPTIKSSTPVVEATLLTTPQGHIVILANYTYKPIANLTVEITLPHPMAKATSTEGKPVRLEKTPTGLRLRLPL